MDSDLKSKRREKVRTQLPEIVDRLNGYLEGRHLDLIKGILERLGRNRALPHWFERLESDHTLPNLDGKTIGSVVEMLFVADIERNVLRDDLSASLKINPASGVDVPDLDLGIKSPSENWCTSEPFTHAYERILGSEYDVVAMITNYQTAKNKPPLRLQIIASDYLFFHQVADKHLCEKARILRDNIGTVGEIAAQKVFRFLAYANQSDWLCKSLLEALVHIGDEPQIIRVLEGAVGGYAKTAAKAKKPVNEEYPHRIRGVIAARPINIGLITASDDWVIESWRNTAQMPTHHDWERFQRSPLDGKIGVSFALQWRYTFGPLFRELGDLRTGETAT